MSSRAMLMGSPVDSALRMLDKYLEHKKMGVDLNTKCVTIFLTQSKISYKPRIMHKFCRFDKIFFKFTPTLFHQTQSIFEKLCQHELVWSAENCTKGPVLTRLFSMHGQVIRVGHSRRFVHVAPQSTYLGPMSSWITKFSKLNLGNHLRHGLRVL